MIFPFIYPSTVVRQCICLCLSVCHRFLLFCCCLFSSSYLLPDTKNKQKTPTVKSEVSATWEHTLVFEGALASLDDLPSRTLEATVWDFDKHSANDFLGGLMLGLGDKASPIEKQHWAALLSTPSGSWVERRHNLHQSNRR